MDIIYPKKESTIDVPKGFSGDYEQVVLEATHRLPEAVIHWHLNEEYLGSTEVIHQIKCIPKSGENTLQLIDQDGNSKLLRFMVK
jgi:penicillin-binding protein 1C